MNKLIKNFLFWFVLFGLIVNLINLTGNDSKNIILIAFNPLLNLLEDNAIIRDFIRNNGFYLWNILSMLSFIAYGLLLDVFVRGRSHTLKRKQGYKN